MSKLSAPATPRLDDEQTEIVRRELERKIIELQKQPGVGTVFVTASLADGVATKVAHTLGRRPTFVGQSIVRGATSTGRIVESARDELFVTLTAIGWGATIALELQVA